MSNFCSRNGIKNDKTLCDFTAVNACVSRVYNKKHGIPWNVNKLTHNFEEYTQNITILYWQN